MVRTSLRIIGWIAAPIAAQQQSPLPSAPTPQIKVETNPDSEGIYHVGKEVTAPKLILSVSPEFSEQSRKRKLSPRRRASTKRHSRPSASTASSRPGFKVSLSPAG